MLKYCIYRTYTIKEVIDKIDEMHDRAALVVNDEDKLIGVISQGDIIRALNSGKNLYSMVDSITRPDFFYLRSRDMKKAYKIFKREKITLMPIVDEDFILLDVITLEDIYNYLEESKSG